MTNAHDEATDGLAPDIAPSERPVADQVTPAPVPPAPAPPSVLGTVVRPGDLAVAWRVVLFVGWVAAFFAYAAVWQASVQIGIGTWWIGPRALPAPAYLRLLPFALTLVLAVIVVSDASRVVRASFVGTLLAAAIAIPDFSRSTGLALAELVIAALLLIITMSSLTGRYRLRPAGDGLWAPPSGRPPGDAA